MSLRRRVLLGFVAVAAVLVVTNLVLSGTFESYLTNRLDQQLVDASRRFGDRPRPGGPRGGPGGGGPGPGGPSVTPAEAPLSEYYLATASTDGGDLTEVGASLGDEEEGRPSLDAAQLTAHAAPRNGRPRPFTADDAQGGGSWRVAVFEDPGRGGLSVVAVSLDETRATLGRIWVVQLSGTAAVLLAVGLVSWWVLRSGVGPLAAMARTADGIAAGDLSRRVEHVDERTEAGRLGTALNAMLEGIEEAFRQREASEARVRQFAADASHELRTPLTSLQGYAELWRAGGMRTEDEQADAMRRIEQEARRMATLVEELLLLARLDQPRPLERAPVRLDELAADAVTDARAVEPDRPIELHAQPVVVDGDDATLRQVLANLLGNARVHTPAGTPVEVLVSGADGTARLEVADRGPGLDAAQAAKVFERFYRADRARARTQGGSGLGLAIVAAVAEAHGGRATVESSPGRGSRFIVELPASKSAHGASTAASQGAG
jgi:two-component system OmpR family sensor kinase